MADFPSADFGPAAEDRASLRRSFFGSLVGQATVLVGLLIFYFGGLATLVKFAPAYQQLRNWLEGDFGPAIGVALFYVILAAPLLAVLLFSALPLALRARNDARLRRCTFEAVPEPPPSLFRLSPYGAADHGVYNRVDGQESAALAWLRTSPGSILYLSGESGVGKSSLVAAHLIPELRGDGWLVLESRAYGDAVGRIAQELATRRDLFPRPPSPKAEIRDLLATIGDRRRKSGQAPLIIVLDQFEEVLILAEPGRSDPFRALIEDLAVRPVDGVKLLMVYRSDYESEIFKLNLPPPVPGANAFRLGRYNRREAEAFLKAGGRLPAAETRDALCRGLDRIEGAPGLYRQITLNMVGLFLERMGDRLTGDPDKLIQSYLDGAIREGSPDAAAARQRILDVLVSDAGTKRPRTEAEIVDLTGLEPYVVRATLHGLSDKGLVRSLQGEEVTWEIAHDFLAALLGRALGRVKSLRWARIQPVIGPVAVIGWLAVLAVGLPWWLQRSEVRARETIIAAEGSIHGVPNGLEVRFDVQRLSTDCTRPSPRWSEVLAAVGRLPDVRGIDFVGGAEAPCRTPENLDGLPALQVLDTLTLCGVPLTSLGGLPMLPALTELNLCGTRLASLEGMPSMPALTTLNLSGTPIANLEGLPPLPELGSLDLSNTPIASLEGLPPLPALSELYLSYTQISTAEGLPALPALSTLYLSGTPIASLAGLPELPALTELDLPYTPIASLEGLPALPALSTLNLSGAPIVSLDGLPVLPALSTLYLSGARIASLKGLPELPALTTLNLSGTPIMSLEGLPALPALSELYLSNTQIATVEGLPVLPALSTLYLSGAPIASLEGLPELPALSELNLSYTSIATVDGLPVLPALSTLDLSDTQIASLESLPPLPALSTLNLSDTPIASLEDLPALPALKSLSLSNTQITALDGLPTLPTLNTLELSGTKIASLEGMPALPALSDLGLSNTKISSLEGVQSAPKLESLVLYSTPVTDLRPLKGRDPMPQVYVDYSSLLKQLE